LYGRALMLRALRRVAQTHPRVGLALFGAGVPAEQLAAEARAEGVEERINDFGELSHPTALALMRGCDAFVRPTSADGDAVSVREALALGVACVASDAVPRPSGVVLFRSGDAIDLARTIARAPAMEARWVESPDVGCVLLELYAKSFAERSARVGSLQRASTEASLRASLEAKVSEVRPGLDGGDR
ncbi:MAG TPA: glycosyltransferase, partial [Myxococcaceae bacterium]|nr:glycosyltransferase [Myxococcaceae bacterium]